MRFAIALCALLLTSACAWTSEAVDIQRQSVPVATVPGAAGISVSINTLDARQEREVSHKKNGYGMRAADITVSNDLISEINNGIREIFFNQGFREGSDALVRVEISRFYNSFDVGFWSATANAQAIANLQVSSSDGRGLYARTYIINHQMPGVQLMTGDNAATALRAVLHGLLRQIADDPQLTRALLQVQPPITTTPETTEPGRRGRGRVGV